MPTSVRVEINRPAVGDFLKGPEVRADIQRRVDAVEQAAGPGYEAVVFEGKDRVQGIVRTATLEARRSEAENHSLLGALQAGAL